MATTAPETKTSEIPVLICGAGPTGLMAGLLLAKMNIPVRVLERDPFTSPLSKAVSIHARTLEILQLTDPSLIQQFLNQGRFWKSVQVYMNGKIICDMPPMESKDTRFKTTLLLEQNRTVKILGEAFEKAGGRFDRGWELMDTRVVEGNGEGEGQEKSSWVETTIRKALVGTNLRANESKVMGTTELAEEDAEKQYEYETVKSMFLIGADGGRSTVRHKIKMPFQGLTRDNSIILFDGFLDTDISTDNVVMICGNFNRTVAMFPLGDENRVRIIYDNGILTEEQFEAQKSETVTQKHFQRLIDETMLPIRMKVTKVNWLTYYRVNERRAKDYCYKGRIFLAGDAAHVHSPAGGQGMNTGLQDAYNLTWKMAMVINGTAPHSLLDSYQEERPAIADEIIHTSANQLRIGLNHNFFKRLAIRVVLSFLPIIMPILAYRPPAISMLGLRYYENSLNKTHKTQVAPTGPGAIGRRAADSILIPVRKGDNAVALGGDSVHQNEVRLYDLLAFPGVFHVLAFTGTQWQSRPEAASELAAEMDQRLGQWRSKWPLSKGGNSSSASRGPLFMMHSLTVLTETRDNVLELRSAGEGKAYVDVDGLLHSRYGVEVTGEEGALFVIRPDTHIAFRVQGVGADAWSDVEGYFESILI
ncbi:phenol 2-monooxygenase (NADPH) [Entomortierella parvispora]|uniref:Phenol 2-monooxygenase (NADPH) n=1 Tax=Entomortierella parvispora TaxID=205924 RepID=A0A9P3HI54_9FUNG|nr:phenol 2-monooxygenase (NADPH) [Entomortierella parvispora]